MASKQKDIDAKLPAFEELEKFFEEKTKEYELKKKQIVGRCISSVILE